jgi:hypothetical protein
MRDEYDWAVDPERVHPVSDVRSTGDGAEAVKPLRRVGGLT